MASLSHKGARRRATSSVLHDIRSPLMSILANAEHVEELASSVSELRDALAAVPLAPEHRRRLLLLLDDLAPLSADLRASSRRLDQLVSDLAAAQTPLRR